MGLKRVNQSQVTFKSSKIYSKKNDQMTFHSAEMNTTQ